MWSWGSFVDESLVPSLLQASPWTARRLRIELIRPSRNPELKDSQSRLRDLVRLGLS